MSGAGVRVRFAPSPTGSLHLGNARTALFNWLVARQAGGTMILRIEDTDTERDQEGSEASILEDLRWLGLLWDEGPGIGGPHAPYRQSERGTAYREVARELMGAGRAYRCFCTDEDLERERATKRAAGLPSGYSGLCREMAEARSAERAAAGEPFAIRFRSIPKRPGPQDLAVDFHDRLRGRVEFAAAELSDPVLLRRDGRPTYNFAVVVDDAAMGVTLVLRGDDHLSNTPRQILLYRALGLPPPEFAHLPMVRGPDGERLSKRHGATSVAEYRGRGYLPEGLLNALALLGWSPGDDRTIVDLETLVQEFRLERVSRSPAIFDPVKLDWVAGQHLRRCPASAIVSDVGRRLAQAGLLPSDVPPGGATWLLDVTELVQASVSHLDEVPRRAAVLFTGGGRPVDSEADILLASEDARLVLEELQGLIEQTSGGEMGWPEMKRRLREATGLKGGALFHPIRAALTGEPAGPELDRLIPLIQEGHRVYPEKVPSVLDRVRRTLEAFS